MASCETSPTLIEKVSKSGLNKYVESTGEIPVHGVRVEPVQQLRRLGDRAQIGRIRAPHRVPIHSEELVQREPAFHRGR